MKHTLLLSILAVLVTSCERFPNKSREGLIAKSEEEAVKLTISDSARSSLKEKKAIVVLDRVLMPSEEIEFTKVSGFGSIGYYIDSQFSLNKANGFVRLYGTDGSESGSAYGAEFRRNDGPITASYTMVNEGNEPRHVIVYVTKL